MCAAARTCIVTQNSFSESEQFRPDPAGKVTKMHRLLSKSALSSNGKYSSEISLPGSSGDGPSDLSSDEHRRCNSRKRKHNITFDRIDTSSTSTEEFESPHKFDGIPEKIIDGVPFKGSPFIADKREWDHLLVSGSIRKKLYKRSAEIVRFDQFSQFQLNGYFDYKLSNQENKIKTYRFLGERCSESINGFQREEVKITLLEDSEWSGSEERIKVYSKMKKEKSRIKQPPKELFEYAKNGYQYMAPKKRIGITRNITCNIFDIVPVYSDVPGETLETLDIPSTFVYKYKDENMINAKTEPDLMLASQMALHEQNMIRCDCCSKDPIVKCYENPDCPCFKLNKKLQRLQKKLREDAESTEFKTFKPILFDSSQNVFYENVGFACSESCGCKGRCDNNSLLLLHKKIFPFELYRSNPILGFALRSYVMIPAGTPIMEFTGEIIAQERLHYDNQDYAYQATYTEDCAFKELTDEMEWTKEYRALLNKLHRSNYFIDPKKFGNIARTASHSCIPNTDILRVYQKSLSPAHVRLVMITLIDIYPGIPITLDYGTQYVTTQLKDKCMCGTFACHNGKHFEKFKKLDYSELAMCVSFISSIEYDIYVNEVVKISKEKAAKRIFESPDIVEIP
ncbi:unnamed protein product [Caenorhabditis sp. 36 PRJEB53466]|nr:unnamed protein product [Caenorhabditis sp. 36 PRJEB53466]